MYIQIDNGLRSFNEGLNPCMFATPKVRHQLEISEGGMTSEQCLNRESNDQAQALNVKTLK